MEYCNRFGVGVRVIRYLAIRGPQSQSRRHACFNFETFELRGAFRISYMAGCGPRIRIAGKGCVSVPSRAGRMRSSYSTTSVSCIRKPRMHPLLNTRFVSSRTHPRRRVEDGKSARRQILHLSRYPQPKPLQPGVECYEVSKVLLSLATFPNVTSRDLAASSRDCQNQMPHSRNRRCSVAEARDAPPLALPQTPQSRRYG